MRIALINPIATRFRGYLTMRRKIPQLGLQVLANLTPPPHTIDIIDEVFGSQATDRHVRRGRYDLVGITSYSSGAARAYEIAAQCRQEGIPTIMGGPHAWACPDEAAAHFDSIALGECDEIWPEIVADAQRGEVKPRYTGRLAPLDQAGMGRAAQHLQPINGRYNVAAIQTSRGCPVGCDFCSVTQFNGPTIRRRDVGDIIDEWNHTPGRLLFVADDNFFGVGSAHAEWAKGLLRQIIKHCKKTLWFGQTTINMGVDAEALDLAYKAGCRGMLIGFETFNAESLKDFHKSVNRAHLGQYKTLVDSFHRAGIPVFGAFIIGADHDSQATIADTTIQSVRLGIDTLQFTHLTPLPGTRVYRQYMDEGRIFATDYPADWQRYTFVEMVFEPRRMSVQELEEAFYELRHVAANTPWVWRLTLRTLWKTRSLTSALFMHGANSGLRRTAKLQLPRDRERFGFVPRPNARTRKIRDALTLSLSKYREAPTRPGPRHPPREHSGIQK